MSGGNVSNNDNNASSSPITPVTTSASNDANIAKPGTIGYVYDFLDKTIKECSDARNYVMCYNCKDQGGNSKYQSVENFIFKKVYCNRNAAFGNDLGKLILRC
jgi:hypothetical protein